MFKIETGKAKAAFSQIKKRAQTQDVAVTRHGKVEVYMVSPERYERFLGVAEAAPDSLKKLEDEYRRMFEKMQSPGAQKAYRELATLPLEEILARGALRKKPARTKRNASR
ncbi:MAG TPA: type II toxin-antitoxin system Phd/YefM family antitoxin [Verrucomicrobiae bacterium]|nr:type II toxin-antitoxin system Phd/YefM family antitoxin [Verrucomicrobiae bacterium]